MKNYGVKLGSRINDYIGGTLPYEVRNSSGDWTPYLPIGEIQRGKEDWMDCTIRTDTNLIEIQEYFLTGVISNYNDREVAIGARVTRQGAYAWQGPEYIRKTGLARQETWPDSGGTFDEQYTQPASDIRQKLDEEKADWLTKWDIKHEDISCTKASLQKHLKHAPLQIIIPGHSVTGIYSPQDIDRIFDSYPPYIKDVPGPYYPGPIIFAKKIVLYKREQAISDNALLLDIKLGDTGRQVEKLLNALDKLNWRLPVRRSNIFVYDLDVAGLVMRFKLAGPLAPSYWARQWERFGSADWGYRGTRVDSVTREYINKLI